MIEDQEGVGPEVPSRALATGGAERGAQSNPGVVVPQLDFRLLTSRIQFDAAYRRATRPSPSVLTLAEGAGLIKVALDEGELPADARAIFSKQSSGETITFD